MLQARTLDICSRVKSEYWHSTECDHEGQTSAAMPRWGVGLRRAPERYKAHHHQNGIETGEIGKDDNIGKDENDIISDRKDLIDAIDHENFRDSMSPAD